MLAAVRGELGPTAARELERHAAACEDCGAELRALRRAWEALDAGAGDPPPPAMRDAVLAAVAAARELEARSRPSWLAAMKSLPLGIGAALASAALLVLHDPDCRDPFAIACCAALWASVYGLAFALLVSSRRGSPWRTSVGRGLVAAGAGLLLVRFCPLEAGQPGFAIPLVADLAARAAGSPAHAFGLGMAVVALPLVLAILVIPTRRRPLAGQGELVTAGIAFALLAPALYLTSSFLALAGLAALLAGAGAGALGPIAVEWTILRALRTETGHA